MLMRAMAPTSSSWSVELHYAGHQRSHGRAHDLLHARNFLGPRGFGPQRPDPAPQLPFSPVHQCSKAGPSASRLAGAAGDSRGVPELRPSPLCTSPAAQNLGEELILHAPKAQLPRTAAGASAR
ncbi:hypothetical protein ZWY2020_037959 [Hordeum vulgare]|nr:hypothetical protein ZWY2020_037959 [Hordeum vulgare]